MTIMIKKSVLNLILFNTILSIDTSEVKFKCV